jgi:hypothetical protein
MNSGFFLIGSVVVCARMLENCFVFEIMVQLHVGYYFLIVILTLNCQVILLYQSLSDVIKHMAL